MVWLTENSMVPMLTGVFMVIAMLGLGIWGREKRVIYVALVIGALTASIVLCELLIVTDREAVTARVKELAGLVRANDTEGVVSYVSKTRQDTIDRIRGELPRYRFEQCRPTGVKSFETYEMDGEEMATIVFVVFFRAGFSGMPETQPGQREIILDFVKDPDGKWRIYKYDHRDPRKGLSL